MKAPFRILLADDDETFRLLAERALREASGGEDGGDLHLAFVDDGALAVAYLRGEAPFEDRARHPMPDLVLLDQRMRRMDGSEALAEIKNDPAFAQLPVCILSTSDEDRLKAQCYTSGASFFVRKALDYDELRSKLRILLSFFRDVVEVGSVR